MLVVLNNLRYSKKKSLWEVALAFRGEKLVSGNRLVLAPFNDLSFAKRCNLHKGISETAYARYGGGTRRRAGYVGRNGRILHHNGFGARFDAGRRPMGHAPDGLTACRRLFRNDGARAAPRLIEQRGIGAFRGARPLAATCHHAVADPERSASPAASRSAMAARLRLAETARLGRRRPHRARSRRRGPRQGPGRPCRRDPPRRRPGLPQRPALDPPPPRQPRTRVSSVRHGLRERSLQAHPASFFPFPFDRRRARHLALHSPFGLAFRGHPFAYDIFDLTASMCRGDPADEPRSAIFRGTANRDEKSHASWQT